MQSWRLCSVIMQERCVSRSLPESKTNDAQKEMFAVLFGLKRFHQYAYGRHVIVERDLKPLEFIMKKPLAAVPLRLQRMILRIQKYDITITHRPGKDIPVADALQFLNLQDDNLNKGMTYRYTWCIKAYP